VTRHGGAHRKGLQRYERFIDEGAHPKFNGTYVLALTWTEEASRDQGFDFSRTNLNPDTPLSPTSSLAVAAHAFGG
jgi:hypothetical protein